MSDQSSKRNDLFIFKNEESSNDDHQFTTISSGSKSEAHVWKILLVDDEEDVHDATTFALRNTEILDRPLEFYHAYNSEEAIKILKRENDIAVILLDVVMETPNAGLDLISKIRDKLNNHNSRIILRTGEPNQAPELDVIRDYDINDYKIKSELTTNKLFVSLTSALRSYNQIKTIDNSKKGLDLILRSSSELITQDGLHNFAQGVIIHIAALLNVPPEGVICVRRRDVRSEDKLIIIAAAGDYCSLIDRPLSDMDQALAQDLLTQSLNSHCNVFHREGVALYLGSHERGDMSCFIASGRAISNEDQDLLKIFSGNIALCADNISFLEQLRSYAFTDNLVGLPNKNALEGIINEHLDQGVKIPYSLALIDVGNFAEINAVLGQEYGDQLLRAITERLKGRFYKPNTVARVGGVTFAVFGPTSHIEEKPLMQPFNNPFEISGELQTLHVSVGIVPLDQVEGRGLEAIKYAGIVLKQAKKNACGEVVMFEQRMINEARVRLETLKNLRLALEKNQIFLEFQPKLTMNETVAGFEALVRWKTAEGKLIPPLEFIPLAEQTGFIIRMGEWILRTAIAELSFLHENGYAGTHMAINISVAQLEHPEMLEMLHRVIGESDISPEWIELEITESIAMGDIESNIKTLHAIREMGFKLSMDDFGTGFSSLTYLQKMPLNCLKIDRSFVNTSNSESGREIVEMIIQLGKTLGLKVIAEGVEEEHQGHLLTAMDCDEVQGYFYARPMASEALHAWLAERGSN